MGCPYPHPPDCAFSQRGSPHPTDSTEDEVLAAALNMKEPPKMAYINTAFNTTDL